MVQRASNIKEWGWHAPVKVPEDLVDWNGCPCYMGYHTIALRGLDPATLSVSVSLTAAHTKPGVRAFKALSCLHANLASRWAVQATKYGCTLWRARARCRPLIISIVCKAGE
jgi:hypothetical protein